MADGKVHLDARARCSVIEMHLHRVADVTLVGGVVLLRENGVFAYLRSGTQRIDPRIPRDLILIVGRREPAEQQGNGHHVLDAMIPVGRIGQRSGLVDDAYPGLLRFDRSRGLTLSSRSRTCGCRVIAASTAVCAWNSAGNEILNRMFSHDVAAEFLRQRERIALNNTS